MSQVSLVLCTIVTWVDLKDRIVIRPPVYCRRCICFITQVYFLPAFFQDIWTLQYSIFRIEVPDPYPPLNGGQIRHASGMSDPYCYIYRNWGQYHKDLWWLVTTFKKRNLSIRKYSKARKTGNFLKINHAAVFPSENWSMILELCKPAQQPIVSFILLQPAKYFTRGKISWLLSKQKTFWWPKGILLNKLSRMLLKNSTYFI